MNKSWLALLLALCGCGSAHAASFDCSKARLQTEKLICGNSELSELDTKLGEAFREASQDLPAAEARRLTQDQSKWLREVRNLCMDVACLRAAYMTRLNEVDPFADMNLTCEEMRQWPRQIFGSGVDLGSGLGSPTGVDGACKESLGQRTFMQAILQLAEEIRNEDYPTQCSGTLPYAHRRYYDFNLTEAGMSPGTMDPWPVKKGQADWTSYEREEESGTPAYFRHWSEQSLVNLNAYSRFVAEFDKAASELTRLYIVEHGLSVYEARAATKRALGLVVGRAAGSAPRVARSEEYPLIEMLRAGVVTPDAVRKAMYGIGGVDPERALRVALIHNQPVDVIAVLEERYSREGVPPSSTVPEPLLSLALEHLPNLQYLLSKQYPVDETNGFGKTALFYAIGSSNHEAVAMLLRANADVRRTYKSEKELRPSGYDCTYPNLRHTRRSTLMHAAQNSDVQMLKLLLDAGAILNARDDLGYNAYDYAVVGKRMENAQFLASLGLKAAVAQ